MYQAKELVASVAARPLGLPATAIREINILKECTGHRNVISLLRVDLSARNSFDLVFELMDMDLFQFLGGDRHLYEADTRFLVTQLLQGLDFLHGNSIIHRDLKPQNLLLRGSRQHGPISLITLKIADFGLARWLDEPVTRFASEMITLWYRPPDLILGNENYSAACDIWSVGCIMAEMLRHPHKPLFAGDREETQLRLIGRALGRIYYPAMSRYVHHESFEDTLRLVTDPPKAPLQTQVSCSVDALDILHRMLQCNPDHRCSARGALQHHFFSSTSTGSGNKVPASSSSSSSLLALWGSPSSASL